MNWVIEVWEIVCMCGTTRMKEKKKRKKKKKVKIKKQQYEQTDMLRKGNLLHFWENITVFYPRLYAYNENLLIPEYFSFLLFFIMLLPFSSLLFSMSWEVYKFPFSF
jgi:hypothetical protein